MQDRIYSDTKLTALYDALNPLGADSRFYLDLADQLAQQKHAAIDILDLGCGTGLLATEFAATGARVTGIDPAHAMLEIAQRRRGVRNVTWQVGDATTLTLSQRFDLIVMTGHVFQVFLHDEDIRAVFENAFAHLRPGGCLAFETRNPEKRMWTDWTPEKTRRTITIDGMGPVEVYHQLREVHGDLVTFETRHRFIADDTTKTSHSTLRFLPQSDIDDRLRACGFDTVDWYGDWGREPVTKTSGELIAIAWRPGG